MKAAVWSVPKEWTPSKFDNTEVKRVVFKGLDDNKSYYLNLNTKFPNQVKSWEPHLNEGTVLDVTLQGNGKSINYFIPFYIIKDITKA
jgi:hypothetical protein